MPRIKSNYKIFRYQIIHIYQIIWINDGGSNDTDKVT